jgi:hypothetical protein
LMEIAQQKDCHAHFEFKLMICDPAKLQSVQKFHRIQWIHWNFCSSTYIFSVKVKEFAFKYMCNYLDNDSRIALLTSSTSIFLGAIMLRCIRYMACPKWR